MQNRILGPYGKFWAALIVCNGLVPQLLWKKSIRSSVVALWLISMVINAGMWLERFVIIISSLHREFVPSEWGMYRGTIWDWATFIGTLGVFMTLMLLFVRFLPMIAMSEMRTLTPGSASGLVHEREEHA